MYISAMNIEEYREYCLSKYLVTEDNPFSKSPSTLLFKVAGKMFTATDMDSFEGISIKCDPLDVEPMRAKYKAVIPPAYMNKNHWNYVLMDGSIPQNIIRGWIDKSYDLVVAKLPKAIQKEIRGE